MLNFRLIRAVMRNSGLSRAVWMFLAVFVGCSVLLALAEPGVGGFGNALWCCFEAATTIGFGDVPVEGMVGRIIVCVLSVVSIFFLAVLTASVVSYCSELMLARRNESLALFMDRLEHLDELSPEELKKLSAKVRALKGKRD